MVTRLLVRSLVPLALVAALPAQRVVRGGDLRRLEWVRPFAPAVERAAAEQRLLLVKPILGGSNTPDPDGLPCAGKEDCEGSW